MKYFILIPLLLLSTISSAQIVYSTTVNERTGNATDPVHICSIRNNECIIAGASYTSQTLHFVSHVNQQGLFQWNKTFSLSQDPLFIRQLLPLDDSTVMITASTSQKFSLIKCSINGDTLWTSSYSIDTGTVRHIYVKKAVDGTFLLCGFREFRFINSGFIARLDSLGNIVQSVELNNWPLFIEPTSDNGLIGFTYDHDLIRLDSAFNLIWGKSIRIPGFSTGNPDGFRQLEDGSLVCSSPMLLFRTDSSGNLLWSKYHQSDGLIYYDLISNRITEAADGKLLSYLTNGCISQDVFTLDTNGVVLQSVGIYNIAAGICATPDSGFIALGGGPICLVTLPGFPPPYEQLALSKANASFNTTNCGSSSSVSLIPISLQISTATTTANSFFIQPSQEVITVDTFLLEQWPGTCVQGVGGFKDEITSVAYFFPNPGSGLFQLKGKENIASFTIENSLGSIVYRSENTTNAEWIDLSALDNGMYFYRMTNFAGKPISGKVIIQH